MFSQLEFMMQLYMMNLLQQQQQQQQQLQQQHTEQSIFSATSIKSQTPLTQPQEALTLPISTPTIRTQDLNNSHNINCSSSCRFSSNSNLSPISAPSSNLKLNTPPLTNPTNNNNNFDNNLTNCGALHQMLLNSLSPIAQFLLMKQQQQLSNTLVLTPTTPNTSTTSPTLNATDITHMQTAFSNVFDCLTNQTVINNFSNATATCNNPSSISELVFPTLFHNLFVGSQNFLNLSTASSTSNTPKGPSAALGTNIDPKIMSAVTTNESGVGGGDSSDHINQQHSHIDENQPLSSLYKNSSRNSAETPLTNSKVLTRSCTQVLQSIDDTTEKSVQEPLTPTKSNLDINHPRFPCPTGTNDENSNVTPITLRNVILTPPSSEQLPSSINVLNNFENSSSNSLNPSNPSPLLPSPQTTTSSSLHTTTTESFFTEENIKHLRKYSSYLECENSLCRQENLREHFHCYKDPCNSKILSKKDDIIRHLKWHKKRKESLLLGFARFSSSDDCEPVYGPDCIYNWKQTHYHCVYEECPKVYVSTSDVQMHANFHRKNSEIVQEGFRRFRAHENCKVEDCPFYGKKTSHYHCCREACNHTFKNKADMDKHKTYHLKDYQLTQDGFKKILKTEHCPFDGCKSSGVSNHIHCVRDNCNFILHSSTQMISHKRKHDREEEPSIKREKESTEDNSPTLNEFMQCNNSNVCTPLSSLSAEHFLARKRGRPPKKIQLTGEILRNNKRTKLETCNSTDTTTIQAAPTSCAPPILSGFKLPPLSIDANAPNFQLTHLMALFQLQNPLFYQNLYPGASLNAANIPNFLERPPASGSQVPPTSLLGLDNSVNVLKNEYNEKQDYKK